MEFTERSSIEVGFNQVFEDEVQPKLIALEADRHAALHKAYRDLALVPLAAVAIMVVLYLIWGAHPVIRLGPLVVIGAGLGLWAVWRKAGDAWKASVDVAIMPSVCAHIGDLKYDPNGRDFQLEKLRSLKLLPSYDNGFLKSRLSGTYQGTGYEMVHATLQEKISNTNGGTRTKTVFTGLLFRIDVPISAPGRIVLMRDRGGFGNKLAETFAFGSTRSLPKVNFDHDVFEAAFEVYADRPEEAKTFMPTAFLEALLLIGAEQGQGSGAQAFVAGFDGNSFYMSLERHGAFMEMGSLTTSVADLENDLHAVFDDIALTHQVIDRLHGVEAQH